MNNFLLTLIHAMKEEVTTYNKITVNGSIQCHFETIRYTKNLVANVQVANNQQ